MTERSMGILQEADELRARRKEDGDWAEQKAREWYLSIWARAPQDALDQDCPSLAALLREGHKVAVELGMVAAQEALLVEVRRVVESVREGIAVRNGYSKPWEGACAEILRRLEGLK